MRSEKSKLITYALTALLAASPLLAYALGLWDKYWKVVTDLGDEPAYVALATILYVGVSRELGVTTLLALITSAWVNVYLKNLLALPRPPRELWKVEASGYGFPSGHAQTSSAFWSALGFRLRKPHLIALGAVVIFLIAASRVVLGVHYLHDVLGGIALGLLVAWLTVAVVKRVGLAGLRCAAVLAAYGLAVPVLYFVYPDPTFVKMGGVALGISAYPLAKRHLEHQASVPLRALVTVAVLVLAFVLTRFFDKQPPVLQFAGYALTVLVITLSPAIYKLSTGARGS